MASIGNYKIKKQIGEGGFGRVYEAEHKILKEKACIKQNIRGDPEEAALLMYEAKLLWNLDEYHSIPAVKDFFQLDEDSAVIIMKHIEGKTLEELVESKGALHPEDASWIGERLLGALYYAHSHGVIHTDVKPENVFVEPKKRDIKLIDFGMASFKPTSKTRPIGYSPKYAAPELVRGQPPIPETDLYGAGIVMLRALGGDVAKKSFRSDTPEEIVEFCNKLLLYDPRERPNWHSENLIESLSDIRQKVFGRRHLDDKKKLKGGVV
tara:strand:- start:205 stop:1002 length:798 start_codon:yes stop_codon:yes gene_type:complete